MDAITLGRRIAGLRKSRGLAQRALAKKVGVHYLTLSKWERGLQELRGGHLRDVAVALGISVSELTANGSENVSRETTPVSLAPDLRRELERVDALPLDEREKVWRIEAIAGAYRAAAIQEESIAARIRAEAMRGESAASGERARAAVAAEESAAARARAAEHAAPTPPAPIQPAPRQAPSERRRTG